MRLGFSTAIVVLVLTTSTFADERARVLLERALNAHGGEFTLKKLQMVQRKGNGELSTGANPVHFTEEVVWSLPDRMRMVVEINKQTKVVTVLNGNQAWQQTMGPARELGKELGDELRNELYIWWLATLTPLKGDGFELSSVPEIKVNDAMAEGFKVIRKDRPEVRLYFDRQTNLLLKIESQVKFAGLMVSKEYLFSDYVTVEGIRVSRRLVEMVNGKKVGERTSAEYKFLPKIEDATFNRP